MLSIVFDNCKNQKICYQGLDNYADTLEYVPDCYKTQKMCYKTVDTCPFVFHSIHD